MGANPTLVRNVDATGNPATSPPAPASAALTDASIASATGASQIIAAANTARVVLNVSNPATTSWWINETGGAAVASGAGCFELLPGQRWTPRPAPTNAVTAIGTAASKLTVVTG